MTEAARRRFRIDQVGQVFQAFELLEYLSVSENILLPRLIDSDGRKNTDAQQRIQSLLASVGLQDKADKRPAELSHGERQRVAVCRAMFNRPQLLLADEPTGNLDQANKQNVVELLIRQARQHDSMLLMVTHDHSMLDAFERVVFKSLVLLASVTLMMFLPAATRLLVADSTTALTARAQATPLLLGERGGELDLVLNALYFHAEQPPALPYSALDDIEASGLADGIPLYTRFRARGAPIVGTSLDYFEFRNLQLAAGRMMGLLGEAVVGANVASEQQRAGCWPRGPPGVVARDCI